MTPGDAEWSKLITASKVAAILGVSPFESPRALWHMMRGDVERPPGNKHTARGHYLEPAILAWWQDQHPEMLLSVTQPTYTLGEWAAATPDARATDTTVPETVLVEAKSARNMDEWGEPDTDQIPAYYLSQVYWQLHLSGAPRCFVPVIGPFLDFHEYVVEADPEVGALLEAKCRTFYDSLSSDEPPELDDSLATFEVLKRLHPLIEPKAVADLPAADAREFVEACNDKERAEARERLARARVLEHMGTANYADTYGIRVARRQGNKSGVSLVRVLKDPEAIQDIDLGASA